MPATPRRRWLHLLEIVTVGFPFCGFKILTGRVLMGMPGWHAAGWALTVLGAVDLALNAVGFALTVARRSDLVAVCAFQQVVEALHPDRPVWKEFGLSLDAMFSFGLVAFMVGFNMFPRLTAPWPAVWGVAVVLNVLGAGLGRLAESLGALRAAEQEPSAGR